METLLNELELSLPDLAGTIRTLMRMLTAMALGAVLGMERERTGKSAGLRTHILVALSSAVFVLAPSQAGLSGADLSRVIQGVAAGIGFIGAGAILKLTDEREIKGLTTAGSIWMTAAVGVAAGLGRLGLAVLSVVLAWITLAVLARLEAGPPSASR